MAVTAVITTNTTTATKTQGFGCYSFSAESSTLGTGIAALHTPRWSITSYPAGFTYEVDDPRPGVPAGTKINARDGDWEGWSFAFPMTHAGDYTVRLQLYDAEGNLSTATSAVTVAANSGATLVYLDGNASGANNGTSPTDAYETWAAMIAGFNAGSKANIRVLAAGSQTYATAAATAIGTGFGNISFEWDGSGTKPLLDIAAGNAFNLQSGENATIKGFEVYDSLNDGTHDIFTIQFTGSHVVEDLLVEDISVGGTLYGTRAFFEQSMAAGSRALIKDCDTLDAGALRTSGVFGNWSLLCLAGGVYGPNSVERPFRFEDALLVTFVGVSIPALTTKDGIRFQNSDWNYVHRCNIVRTALGIAGGCIMYGLDSGTPRYNTISQSYIKVNSGLTGSNFCVRDAQGTKTGGEEIVMRATVCEQADAGGFGGAVENTNYALGCTILGASNTSNTSVMVFTLTPTAGEFSANLMSYTGPAVAAPNNDKIWSASSSSMANNDNTISKGENSQINAYYLNGGAASLATINAQANSSGNTEAAFTLDEFFYPSIQPTATVPNGLLADYYGNALTIGGSMIRGAVQSVPISSPLTITNPDGTAISQPVSHTAQPNTDVRVLLRLNANGQNLTGLTYTESGVLRLETNILPLTLNDGNSSTFAVLLRSPNLGANQTGSITISANGGLSETVNFLLTVASPWSIRPSNGSAIPANPITGTFQQAAGGAVFQVRIDANADTLENFSYTTDGIVTLPTGPVELGPLSPGESKILNIFLDTSTLGAGQTGYAEIDFDANGVAVTTIRLEFDIEVIAPVLDANRARSRSRLR